MVLVFFFAERTTGMNAIIKTETKGRIHLIRNQTQNLLPLLRANNPDKKGGIMAIIQKDRKSISGIQALIKWCYYFLSIPFFDLCTGEEYFSS